MIKTLSFLPLVFITSTVFAGTSTFECTGYSQATQNGPISVIKLNNNTASVEALVDGELYILDSRVDLLSDVLVYQDAKMRTNVNVTVRSKSTKDYASVSAKTEEVVRMSEVKIDAETDGAKATYSGTCIETIVSESTAN